MPSDTEEGDVKFLYDLRQRRAKVIGDQIDLIAVLARTEMYYEYYKAICFLHNISKHAYSYDEKDFDKLNQAVIEATKKYRATWVGEDRKPEGSYNISSALNNLLAFVMNNIEESGLFGTSAEEDSDV